MRMGVHLGVWACFCTGTGRCRCVSKLTGENLRVQKQKVTCEPMGVLMNSAGGILSQVVRVSNHHLVHIKYLTTFLLTSQ